MDIHDQIQLLVGAPGEPKLSGEREVYTISLLHANSRMYYKDSVVMIEKPSLVLLHPEESVELITPYRKECLFRRSCIQQPELHALLDLQKDMIILPAPAQFDGLARIFDRMVMEFNSRYVFKYDLLVSYLSLLLHEIWKYQLGDHELYPEHLVISYQ